MFLIFKNGRIKFSTLKLLRIFDVSIESHKGLVNKICTVKSFLLFFFLNPCFVDDTFLYENMFHLL